jgi:hypothetical protein
MELFLFGIVLGLALAVILAHSCEISGNARAKRIRAILFGGGGGGPQEPD